MIVRARRAILPGIGLLLGLLARTEARAFAFEFFEHRYLGDLACNVLKKIDGERYGIVLDDSVGMLECGYLNSRYIAIAGDHSDSVQSMTARAHSRSRAAT